MPPRDPKPAISRRKSKLNLDMPEPELAETLHQYCDLRRRGFDQQAIKTKSGWTKHHQNLLLEESQRRQMPGSQKSQEQAVTEWLLQMHDAGAELKVIQRASALSNLQTKNRLQAALDAASGPAPTDIIIRNPDGEPTRVSWLDTNGELMHRPFDGAFPADYPAALAVRQCTEVLYRLLGYPNNSARDRAYTMLSMAEAGLHSFDYDSGKWVNAELERVGLDEDAKHTVIVKLHPNVDVGQLLHSPRTRLLASNRIMLHQSRCAALFQTQCRNPLDSLRASAWLRRKHLGHLLGVWHRPCGRRAAVGKTKTAGMNSGTTGWSITPSSSSLTSPDTRPTQPSNRAKPRR